MEPDYDYEIRKVNKTPEEQAHILRENVKKILKGEIMRSLRFRAWDNANKEWLNKGDAEDLIICLDGSYEINRGWVIVKPDLTIEQYTGLKDKNGKEIYEGDIVKFGDSIAVIIWRNKRAEFGVRWTDCGIEDSLSWQVETEKTISEVIGTIHENPELLK